MTRGKSVVWLTLLMFLGFVVSAQANSILDQNNPPLNVGLNDGLEWQQQITVGLGGILSGITLYTQSGTDTDLVRIGVGSAPFTGAWAFQTTVGINAGGTFIDTSSANIALNPNDFFTIDVSGGPGCCNLYGSTSAYSGGDLYLDINGQFTDYTQDFGYSMAFQTYMNTEVPEPGTLVFMGTGVLGLAGILRRKINL
jgi:PEP-CTERM motif